MPATVAADVARQELSGLGKSHWRPFPGQNITSPGMPVQPGGTAPATRAAGKAAAARQGRSGGISPPTTFCAARFFKGISPCKSVRGFNHITPRVERRGSRRVRAGGEPHLTGFAADSDGGVRDRIPTPTHCSSLARSSLEHPRPRGSAWDGSVLGLETPPRERPAARQSEPEMPIKQPRTLLRHWHL